MTRDEIVGAPRERKARENGTHVHMAHRVPRLNRPEAGWTAAYGESETILMISSSPPTSLRLTVRTYFEDNAITLA